MNKLLLLFTLFIGAAWCQINPPADPRHVQTNPTSSCTFGSPTRIVDANPPTFWACGSDNTWHNISGGGGGGATIPSTTNLIKGDGAGNGADSGITPNSSGIIGLFTSCSGTQYLGADGACHTSATGTVGTVNGTTNQVTSTNPTGPTVTLSLPSPVVTPGDLDIAANGLSIDVPNSSTGTTLNLLAKLVTVGGVLQAQVITTSAADQLAAIGCVIAGAGTTGNARIVIVGTASCKFDGATTAGHIAVPSSTSAGALTDTGSTSAPTTGAEVIATVGATNACGSPPCLIAGNIFMTPDLVAGAGNGGSGGGGPLRGSGTTNQATYWSGSHALGSSATLRRVPVSGNDWGIGTSSNGFGFGAASGDCYNLTAQTDTGPANANVVLRGCQTAGTVLNTRNGTFGSLGVDGSFSAYWGNIMGTSQLGFGVGVVSANAASQVIIGPGSFFLWKDPASLTDSGVFNQDAVKISGSTIARMTTSDTGGAIGIVQAASGGPFIATEGNVCIQLDNSPTAGDYVIPSSTTTANGHDAGSTRPACGTQIYGRVGAFGAGGGPCGGSSTEIFMNLDSNTCGGSSRTHTTGFTFGAPGGSALSANVTSSTVEVPYACTITAYNICASDVSAAAPGTVTVKFWKVATGTAKPTSGNSINTSGVSLTSNTCVRSTTVSDFTTTAISANDLLAASLTAVGTAVEASVQLECQF